MLLSKCAICGSKKSRFIKKQEVSGILSSLGLKTLLSKTPLFGDIFFWMLSNHYKINKIVNKFLSVGYNFMPEMHLKQQGFTYSACGSFTKSKEKIQKFKETEDTRYIRTYKLDKSCFQHDMAYRDFKVLTKRTAS